MKKIFTRICVAVLSLGCCLSTGMVNVRAEEPQTEEKRVEVHISSAEELKDVADKVSKGVYGDIDIILDNNIDMTGKGTFDGFASFKGHFNGNNYEITGVTITENSQATGFFGYLEKGAVVEKLVLDIQLSSDNSSYYVGGIAGVSSGLISECTVKGKITGTGATGAVCGLVGRDGTVSSVKNYAVLTGRKTLGGIAGINRGLVENCSNFGAVNATEEWLSLEDSLTVSYSYDKLVSYALGEATDSRDFGGIAGYSLGTITGCTNEAEVGYGAYGKNTGGIVGRVCGKVLDCTNTGRISGKQDVGGIAGQFEPFIIETEGESLSQAVNELSELTDKLNRDVNSAANSLEKDVNKVGDKINESANNVTERIDSLENSDENISYEKIDRTNATDSLQNITREDLENKFNDTKDGLSELKESLKKSASETSREDIENDYEELKNQLQAVTDTYNEVSRNVNKHTDRITSDMNNINDKLNDIQNLTEDRISNLKRIADGGAIIEDYSAVDPDNEYASRIRNCVNKGIINGARNVGGIAGACAIEGTDTQDSEQNQSDKHVTLAVLEDSVNSGIILVSKEYGGGICGTGSLGFFRYCEDSGYICGPLANYIGGIAGSMKGTISNCYSASVVDANDYAGGIAGEGRRVRNSIAISRISASGTSIGEILGSVCSDLSEDDFSVLHSSMFNSIYNNYYNSSEVYGIDGANYEGVAESLSYSKILSLEGCPEIFKKLKAVFLTEDYEILEERSVVYGANISNIKFPEYVPESGEYVVWKGLPKEKTESNIYIVAEKLSSVVTLQSTEKYENKPIAFVSGHFTTNAGLSAQESTAPESITSGSLSHYTYTVTLNGGEKAGEEGKLRVINRAGDGEIRVFKKTTDGFAETEFKVIGSYVEVPFSGSWETVCIVEKQKNFWDGKIVPIIAAFILIEGTVNIILWKKVRRNNKKDKSSAKDRKEEKDEQN